ncbi:MAG: arginine--tRNA ligase [Deltaproteobacteria bacterium]|nr:arginine--tRNA ligase [Deltaproteobacteria bacterium]
MSLPWSERSPTPPASPFDRVRTLLARATERAVETGLLPAPVAAADIALDRPREAGHGDLSTNLAFSLAKSARSSPRAVGQHLATLLAEVDVEGAIAKVEVAGPGFLNLSLAPAAWHDGLQAIAHAGASFGRSRAAAPQRILLEFVSANPTGPLHVGHGRGAVLGDALAAILRAAGHEVSTEYYINNVGNQIYKFGQSVWHWLRDPQRRAAALAAWAQGDPVAFPQGFPQEFPEDGYRGAYIAQIAQDLAGDPAFASSAPCADWDDDAAWAAAEPENPTGRADNRRLSLRAWQAMVVRIAADLGRLGVRFDHWQSERALHGLDGGPDRVRDCAERLRHAGWAYQGEAVQDEDGDREAGRALFFRGTREDIPKACRDGKDRVIVRSDGRPTYFAADIAYHDDKLARGFTHLVNVLGADHHGYVPRLKGVLHALGDLRRQEGDPNAAAWSGDRLEVPLVQMVALLRDGTPVPMGKRSGEFVTLADIMDEVTTAGNPQSGADAVRFTFLCRKADAQLDFDLEVARRASLDNPVYYVQYGHARMCSILSRAAALGQPFDRHAAQTGTHLAALGTDAERDLALQCSEYPELIVRAARSREPHQIAYYLRDLCAAFHGWYTHGKQTGRVIGDDPVRTQARLALVSATAQVVRNGLLLLGISAPERMAALDDDDAPEAPSAGAPA